MGKIGRVVQIIGPTDPVENAPDPRNPSRTVRVGLDCSPCRRGCAAATCMTMITPAAVLDAARELLDAESEPAADERSRMTDIPALHERFGGIHVGAGIR